MQKPDGVERWENPENSDEHVDFVKLVVRSLDGKEDVEVFCPEGKAPMDLCRKLARTAEDVHRLREEMRNWAKAKGWVCNSPPSV